MPKTKLNKKLQNDAELFTVLVEMFDRKINKKPESEIRDKQMLHEILIRLKQKKRNSCQNLKQQSAGEVNPKILRCFDNSALKDFLSKFGVFKIFNHKTGIICEITCVLNTQEPDPNAWRVSYQRVIPIPQPKNKNATEPTTDSRGSQTAREFRSQINSDFAVNVSLERFLDKHFDSWILPPTNQR